MVGANGWAVDRRQKLATILYVDDEAPIRRAVSSWLGRRGHAVRTAGDLATARETLAAEAVDGLFVDIWLGRESGFELQAWIDENCPVLSDRLVFVTGDLVGSDAGTGDHSLGQLGRPVISKPFDLHELEKYVAEWTRTPPS